MTGKSFIGAPERLSGLASKPKPAELRLAYEGRAFNFGRFWKFLGAWWATPSPPVDVTAHGDGTVDRLHVGLLHQHLLHVPAQRLQLALFQGLALLDLAEGGEERAASSV